MSVGFKGLKCILKIPVALDDSFNQFLIGDANSAMNQKYNLERNYYEMWGMV